MNGRFKKIWNDPVWSKVIGGVITAAILALVALSANLYGGTWSKFLSYGVPLWFVFVACVAIFILSTLILSKFLRRTYGFSPEVKPMGIIAPDPALNKPMDYPLKCWWTFRNDSAGCIDVTFSDYKPRNIRVKSLTVSVLQAQMHQQWLPTDHGVPQIAILPGQLFRGWIAPDESQYTAAQVRSQFGSLGTLTMKINGELMNFDL